jgi:hypothetical protein
VGTEIVHDGDIATDQRMDPTAKAALTPTLTQPSLAATS